MIPGSIKRQCFTRQLCWLIFCMTVLLQASPLYAEPDRDCVILLHGMARSSSSMDDLQQALSGHGYLVVNVDYPSTDYPIEYLAENYIPPAIKQCQLGGGARINFVTHSLGGILIRSLLQNHHIRDLGRIVMLSPPNHGSEIADELKDWTLYRWIMGSPGQQLVTGKAGITAQLEPIPGQVGVITGSVSYDPWFSGLLPGVDDGKVSVDSARLEEMQDFLVVESGHAFIMNNDLVISQVLYFLKNGHFDSVSQKTL